MVESDQEANASLRALNSTSSDMDTEDRHNDNPKITHSSRVITDRDVDITEAGLSQISISANNNANATMSPNNNTGAVEESRAAKRIKAYSAVGTLDYMGKGVYMQQ